MCALQLALLLTLAPAEADLTFYAPFDGDATATIAAGDAAASGTPKFTDGLVGQALLGGGDESQPGVTYATAGNLSLTHGTLSVWVKPVDWAGDDAFYHWFCRLKLGQAGYLILYKNHSAGTGLMFGWDPDEGPLNRFLKNVSIRDWRPGEWHHLAAVWADRERVALYLDGREVGRVSGVELPRNEKLGERFELGGCQQDHPGQTALDEVRIYRRALTPAEVLELFAEHGSPEAVEAARQTLPQDDGIPSVRIVHGTLDHQLVALYDPHCLSADQPIAWAELSVQDANGQEVARGRATAGSRVQLPTDGLPLGDYTASLRLQDAAGKVLATQSEPFRIVTTDTWAEAEKLGLEPEVPPPFESVRVAAQTVQAGTSTIQLGPDGLPLSLRVFDEPVLRGAARLTGLGRPSQLNLTSQTAGAARFVALYRNGVTLESRYEFDGLAWFDLRIPSGVTAPGQAIELVVPLPASRAKYLNAASPALSAHQRIEGYVNLPQSDGVLWQTEQFLPAVWVGDDHGGLGWFAESDCDWDSGDRPPIRVERQGDEVRLVCRLRSGLASQRKLHLSWGFQATPVRRLEPGWRAKRWLASADITKYFLVLKQLELDQTPADPPSGEIAYLYGYNHFCNTLPHDPAFFAKMLDQVRRLGVYGCPYTDILDYEESSGIDLLGKVCAMEPGGRFAAASTSARGAVPAGRPADWYLWFAHHLAQTYGLNGFYVDEAWVHPGTGPASAGIGYVKPDGTRGQSWPLLARREMLRRLRNVFASTGRPFWIILHLSSARFPPLTSMGDQLLLGEEFYTLVTRDPVYAHSLTPDRLRAAFLPGSMGIPTVVIPQFKASGPRMKDPQLARGYLAAALPHDLLTWPVFIEHSTVLAARKTLVDHGVDRADTEFRGYWQSGRPVSDAPEGILVSAYLTREGGRLQSVLIVSNVTDEAQPNLKLTLVPPGPDATPTVIEGEGKLVGEVLTVGVPAQDFRIVVLGW